MTYSILSKSYPSELLFKLQSDQKSATSVQIAVLSVTCLAPSWWLVVLVAAGHRGHWVLTWYSHRQIPALQARHCQELRQEEWPAGVIEF